MKPEDLAREYISRRAPRPRRPPLPDHFTHGIGRVPSVSFRQIRVNRNRRPIQAFGRQRVCLVLRLLGHQPGRLAGWPPERSDFRKAHIDGVVARTSAFSINTRDPS